MRKSGQYETDLCAHLIKEHFGSTVSDVARSIIREPGPLPFIASRLRGKHNLATIRKSLSVLEQFGIVGFQMDSSSRVHYSVDSDEVQYLVRAPRCCLIAKTLYGNLAELIFLDLLLRGRETCSGVIRRVFANDCCEETIEEIKKTFSRLAESQFVIRCPPIEAVSNGCPNFSGKYDPFILPDMVLNDISDEVSRKRKAENNHNDDKDAGIYWKINWPRFDRYIRDEIVLEFLLPSVQSSTENSVENYKNTLEALLKVNETRSTNILATSSSPISVVDIVRSAKDHNMGIDRSTIEKVLVGLLEDSHGILRKAGDSGGGLYIIDFEKAFELACRNHIESLIREQLDTKAVRIFRLLIAKHYLEEDQIEKLTMMSSKETRELLFTMLEEGYVFQRAVGKTNDFAPARTYYLYGVDFPQTVRGMVEYTSKVMRNLVIRREVECEQNKRLCDTMEMIESITDEINMNEEKDDATKELEIQEVEETNMPAADKAKLVAFKKARGQLMRAEMECDKTLFTFKLFMKFAAKKA